MIYSSLFNCPLISGLVLLGLASDGVADWRDEIGWPEFKVYAGPGHPDGSGVAVVQAEADSNGSGTGLLYIPNPADEELSGKTVSAQTEGGSNSSHALTVAKHFFGNSTGVAPGVTDIDVYEGDDYLDALSGISSSRKVHCNAWIGNYVTDTPAEIAAAAASLGQIDNTISSKGFLVVGGLNNGGGTEVPHLLTTTYNALSVGLSDGGHSQGGTVLADYGPGRVKPEIVVPHGTSPSSSYTSFATGEVSSVAAVLYDAAASGGHSDVMNQSEVMKAILMAGAVKFKFDDWDRTVAQPLDEVFGAGEVNILHSYQILEAGEQNPGVVETTGWSYNNLRISSTSRSYSFVLSEMAAECSILLNWNYSGSGVVRDLKLELERTDGGTVLYDQSDSPVDNVEHIYCRNLPAGTYTVTVSRSDSSISRISYGLAWRTSFEGALGTGVGWVTGQPVLTVGNVFKGKGHTIHRSTDLVDWTPVHVFTPTTWDEHNWTDSAPLANDPVFYRTSMALP